MLIPSHLKEKHTSAEDNHHLVGMKNTGKSCSTTPSLDLACHCGVQVVVRTSKTTANPNRDFYGCRHWSPKVGRGCDFFEWCDSVPTKVFDKVKTSETEPAETIRRLQLENLRLRRENEDLMNRISYLEEQMHSPHLTHTGHADDDEFHDGSYKLTERVARLEELLGSLSC